MNVSEKVWAAALFFTMYHTIQTKNIQDRQTFERFSHLLLDLQKKQQKIMIIHDVDGDGVCSAKILKEGLEKLGVIAKFRFAAYDRSNLFGDFLMEFIKKNKISIIITLDLNLKSTNYFEKQEQLKDKTIIVFDHHELQENWSDNVIYFHPRKTFHFPEPSQYCTTKIVYDLLSSFTNLSELDWVAAIGVISDSTYPTWKEWVDKVLHRLQLPILESPFDSRLQHAGTLLYYGTCIDREAAEKAIKVFFAARSYEEVLKALQEYEDVGKEVDHYCRNWEQYAQKHGDLIILFMTPKYRINSIVSNKISYLHPRETIVVCSPNRAEEKQEVEFVGCSLRRQDGKVPLPALLQEIASRLPGFVGGGHIQSSGAKCPIAVFSQFKDLLIALHPKYKKQG